MEHNLYDEYPVKLEIYFHKSTKYPGLWDRFVKSLGPNTWVEFELTKQYRAVPCWVVLDLRLKMIEHSFY